MADFTYIWTAEGRLYVAVVIDLFSRRVVGWSMSASMTAQIVTDALVMAIWRCGSPRSVLHHSYRGSQYSADQFQRLIADHDITLEEPIRQCLGEVAMESFFSPLKTECVRARVYRNRTRPEPTCSTTSSASTTEHLASSG